MEKLRTLAAKIFLSVALSFSAAWPLQAGIPVIDGSNLAQNILSAMEAIQQTAKQILQYQTQLQQYESMLQNTLTPATYIWDQAQETIQGLEELTDVISNYKNTLGSLDAYLSKFQDLDYYKSSPCFTSEGCSEADRKALEKNHELMSKSQQDANKALFKGLEQQQKNLQHDAKQLRRLQAAAQSATGQLEAIQYANQLASAQGNQLLQIRSLLIAQQQAAGTKMMADANRQAEMDAASADIRKAKFAPSKHREWGW